jgi:hypothetical protein
MLQHPKRAFTLNPLSEEHHLNVPREGASCLLTRAKNLLFGASFGHQLRFKGPGFDFDAKGWMGILAALSSSLWYRSHGFCDGDSPIRHSTPAKRRKRLRRPVESQHSLIPRFAGERDGLLARFLRPLCRRPNRCAVNGLA